MASGAHGSGRVGIFNPTRVMGWVGFGLNPSRVGFGLNPSRVGFILSISTRPIPSRVGLGWAYNPPWGRLPRGIRRGDSQRGLAEGIRRGHSQRGFIEQIRRADLQTEFRKGFTEGIGWL